MATDPAAQMVRCPKCGKRQPFRTPHAVYRCDQQGGCGAMFDDEPDEGGSHDDRNPAARLEREERRKEHQQARRTARRI